MKINYLLILFTFFSFFIGSCGNRSKNTPETVDTTNVNSSDTLKKLNEKVAADPANAEVLHERAKYYLSVKDYQNSFRDINQVMNLDSTKAVYFLTLSDLYFYTNKTGNSKAALEKAIALDDQNIDALLKLAEIYLYVSKSEKSIEYINKALRIDQYNAKAYFMKGMNYKDLRDTAKAISSMQTAVEQDQTYYHAYMQLGILCAAKKNALAIQYYKNAIRIQPNSKEAWYALGKYYQDVEEWSNAITTYNALISADAHNKYAHYNLGVIYLIHLKKYNLALEQYTAALQIDPNYVEACYGKGVTYNAMGDTQQAIQCYQQCLRINPDYKPAQMELKQLNKLK